MRPPRAEGPTIRSSVAAALLLPFVAAGCGGLTVPQEQALGEEFAREMRREAPLVRDEVVIAYIEDIGERILRASGPQPFTYRFYVIEDPDINASAGPGGHIFVNTGTILRAENVSELAGVLAHEVGHVALRHIAENYAAHRNTSILLDMAVLAASVFGYGQMAQMGGGLAAMGVLNSFGREAEAEADGFAIAVLPSAGYDPNGLVTFLEKIRMEEGWGRPPAFLSSHPATEDRIAETSAAIQAGAATAVLEVEDRGKLQIIQRRIELLTGQQLPPPPDPSQVPPRYDPRREPAPSGPAEPEYEPL